MKLFNFSTKSIRFRYVSTEAKLIAIVTLLFLVDASKDGFSQGHIGAGDLIKDAIFDGTLNQGIYRNFLEFRSNAPSNKDAFYVQYAERKTSGLKGSMAVKPFYTETDRMVKDAWGFCDGVKAYILHDDRYYEIFLDNDELYFYGYDLTDRSKAADISIFLGLAGLTVYTIDRSTKEKSQKIRYLIHSDSGTVNHLGAVEEVAQTELYIYRSADKNNPNPIVLLVNDIAYAFPPESYTVLSDLSSDELVKICPWEMKDSCQLIRLLEGLNFFIKCQSSTEGQTEVFLVDQAEGTFDFAKIEQSNSNAGFQEPVLIEQE